MSQFHSLTFKKLSFGLNKFTILFAVAKGRAVEVAITLLVGEGLLRGVGLRLIAAVTRGVGV
jgi:hypothetical protein